MKKNITDSIVFSDKAEVTVKRGDKSFGHLLWVCSIALSIVLFITCTICEGWYRIIISGTLMCLVIYLVFCNSWIQNKILTIIYRFKNKDI